MPEDRSSKFKKLFSCFGSRVKDPPDEAEWKADVESEIAQTAPVNADAAPDDLNTEIPAQEKNTFSVCPNTALARIWDRYGYGGDLAISLEVDSTSRYFSIAPEAMKTESIRLLFQIDKAASKWLSDEAASIQSKTDALAKQCSREADENTPVTPSDLDKCTPIITPDVDECAQVLVSKDGAVAWLFLLPALGNGKELTMSDGEALLQEANVTIGIDTQALSSLFNQKEYFRLCPVAWCVPPIEGTDGWIKEYFQRDFIPKSVTSASDESDTVDYRQQNNVQAIVKGAVICDIFAPVEGTPGVRVDGEAIPPQPVKAAEVPMGKNTILSADNTKLLSELDGFLEFNNGCFHVKDHLNIKSDIDYSTGNIDFQGDVTINGDVREQFSVKASGNVTINGLVEAATVEAGGDVVISNGVSGNGQAVISGKSVRAKYLESCTVYAETLESNYILSSHVFCDDAVHATGGRGAIIGSTVIAANSVKATSIGSLSGRITEITLGTLPKVRDELCENRKALQEVQSESQELSKRVTYLQKRVEASGRPMDKRSAQEIRSIAERLSLLLGQEQTLCSRQTELTALLSNLPRCRLDARTVYPGVRIIIGNAVRNVDSVINNCEAVYNMEEHDIQFR